MRMPMLVTMLAAGIAFGVGGCALTTVGASKALADTAVAGEVPAVDRTTEVPAAQRCTVDDLQPSMASGIPYLDGRVVMREVSVTLTNVSGAACTLAGRPAATLVGTATGDFRDRFEPAATGTAENVTLGAGDRAETLIRVRDERASGWLPATLELALPGSADYFSLGWAGDLSVAQDASTTVSPLRLA